MIVFFTIYLPLMLIKFAASFILCIKMHHTTLQMIEMLFIADEKELTERMWGGSVAR